MSGGPISNGLDMWLTVKISTSVEKGQVSVRQLMQEIVDKSTPELKVEIIHRARVENDAAVGLAATMPKVNLQKGDPRLNDPAKK